MNDVLNSFMGLQIRSGRVSNYVSKLACSFDKKRTQTNINEISFTIL